MRKWDAILRQWSGGAKWILDDIEVLLKQELPLEVRATLKEGKVAVLDVATEEERSCVSGCEVLANWKSQDGIPNNSSAGPYVALIGKAADSLVAWVKAKVEAEKLDVAFVLGNGDPKQTSPDATEEERQAKHKRVSPTPIKPPSKAALQAYRLMAVTGITNQTELATKMTENGVPATQGQVSRWLKEVKEAQVAGYILPDLPHLDGEPQSIDPDVIEIGERQDGLTPRQRPRRDPDAD